MAGKKTGKRLLTWVLVLVMALSLLPLNVLAANRPETDSSSGMNFTKELLPDQPDDDGNYTIRMTAQATGKEVETTKAVPMDIALVLDVSGSMDDTIPRRYKAIAADDVVTSETYYVYAKHQFIVTWHSYDKVTYCNDCNAFVDSARKHSIHKVGLLLGLKHKYSPSETQFYTAIEPIDKIDALKEAVNGFIDQVAKNSADSSIAVVSFASEAANVSGGLLPVKTDAETLKMAVNNLVANGATRADSGMQEAASILKDGTNEKKVVIMFTDGEPTKHSEFSDTVANDTISAAKGMKDNGTKVFTVGVFDSDPDEKTYDYMNYVSSNYPQAQSMNNHGDGSDKGYYVTADSADSLSKVFKDISETITKPEPVNSKLDKNTVITDTLSDYFTFATDNAAESVTVYAEYADGTVKQSEDATKVKPVVTGNTVTVKSYDFSAHHTKSADPEKLVIEIKVKPSGKDCNSAAIPTNKGNATVTLDNTTIASQEPPTIDGYSVTYAIGDNASWPNNGNGPATLYYPQNAVVAVTDSEPTRDGYEFTGWKSNIEGDNKVYTSDGTNSSITMPAANVVLTAQWRKIEAPELSVTKTVTKVGETTVAANETIPTAYPGDTIEWTITVANSGNAEGNFTLKDVLKGRTDELTVSPAMAEGANSYTIAPKNPTTGEPTTMTFTVTYTVQPADVTDNGLVNTVTMNDTSEESATVPTAQKYTVTGTIDNGGTVTNSPQEVKHGEKSAEMTFTPADGYKITSVTVNGTAVSDLTLNSDGSYTYPAIDSVTGKIAVIVKTDKRTDLSYTVKYVDKITGSEIQSSVVKGDKTFGDKVTGESEKVTIANYTYVEANPDPLTISTDATKNVITLYYTKDAPTPGTFDFNGVVSGDNKVTPAITKTVKGNVGRNFKETFEVTVKGTDAKSKDTMSAPDYTGKAEVIASKSLKDVPFLFKPEVVVNASVPYGQLLFTEAGKYTYTVRELPGQTSRMSYDTTEYTLTIEVVLNDSTNKYEVKSCQFSAGGKMYDGQLNIVNTYRTYHPSTPSSKPTLNTGDHYAYVMGYPDGTVRPNGSITRAEVSTILFRLLSDKTRDEYFTTESSFTDVKAGAWYNNSIATLEKAGVIVDTAKGGAFRPNEAITRAELAAMLAQFSDAKPVKGVKFSDVSAEHWAYEAIAIAAKMGWIEGYPDGTFRPDATITRAEMMTLVNRALERVPSDEDHLLSKRVMLTFPDCKSGDWFYIAVQEATNSHTYERAATEKNGDEQWTALRANRDWTLLEK